MAAERERKRRNVWSDREETIFFEKFMVYPKNFRKIQSFLEWKTEGHCVQFYYLRKHKLDLKRSLKHGSKRRPAQRPPPVSSVKPRMPPEERDPEAWVTNPFRQGMRARARSFSYKESALSDQARLTPILHISDLFLIPKFSHSFSHHIILIIILTPHFFKRNVFPNYRRSSRMARRARLPRRVLPRMVVPRELQQPSRRPQPRRRPAARYRACRP